MPTPIPPPVALGDPASPDAGASRKILVVVNDSPECHVALRFGALRAARLEARMAMLYVLEPSDFKNWGGVDQLIQAEARDHAEQVMQQLAAQVHEFSGMMPEILIRQGLIQDEILAALQADATIRALCLATAAKGRNPGPLVTAFTGPALARLATPLLIVPGHLSDAQIDEIA